MRKLVGGIAQGLDLGNFGLRLQGISYDEICNDFDFFFDLFSKHKVICFRNINLRPHQQAHLTKSFFEGRSAPEERTNESFEMNLIYQQSHNGNPNTETNEFEKFIASQWHVDNAFFPDPPSCMSMVMTKFECKYPNGGTHFASLIDLWNACPPELRSYIEDLEFISNTGNVGQGGIEENKQAIRALRTHPITAETILFWTGGGTNVPDPGNPLYPELRKYVENYLADPENRFTWNWELGDAVFWDNRCLIHSFSPGWAHDQRVFTRGEFGHETPFYDPSFPGLESHTKVGIPISPFDVKDYSSPRPNPDHIPLVYTKGIYAYPELSEKYQTVTMCVYSSSGTIPDDVRKLKEIVNDDDFNVHAVIPSEGDMLERYSLMLGSIEQKEGQKFLFARNGDMWRPFHAGEDILSSEPLGTDVQSPRDIIKVWLGFHPELRHAGHAWHYPDWKPYPNIGNRPWNWRNLAYIDHAFWGDDDPSSDYLFHYAIDTIFGCFNHLRSSEDRRKVIEEIRDFLSLMITLGEYENDR